jgi:hypothetical protein
MADLKSLWQSAKLRHGTNDIIDPEVVKTAIQKRSGGIMDKLRKRVKLKIWFSIASFVFLLAMMLFTNNTAVRILLGFVEAGMLAGIYFFYREYRELHQEIDITQDPAGLMQSFHDRIRKLLRYEEMVGLTLYPPSFTGGFILGTTIDPTKDPWFNEPREWIIFGVILVVVTPLCHWLAKWMNRKSFGKLLSQLEDNIREFKALS